MVSLVVFQRHLFLLTQKDWILVQKLEAEHLKEGKSFCNTIIHLLISLAVNLKIIKIAKKNKVFFIGVIEKVQGILLHILHISDKGTLLCKHRKVMPTAAERLVWGFGDGSTLQTTKTRLRVLGSVICWENYMPMMRMSMYNQG